MFAVPSYKRAKLLHRAPQSYYLDLIYKKCLHCSCILKIPSFHCTDTLFRVIKKIFILIFETFNAFSFCVCCSDISIHNARIFLIMDPNENILFFICYIICLHINFFLLLCQFNPQTRDFSYHGPESYYHMLFQNKTCLF